MFFFLCSDKCSDVTHFIVSTMALVFLQSVIQHAEDLSFISCRVKPHTKLHLLLIHPKDKIALGHTWNVMYEILCKSCNKAYIGETISQHKEKGTSKRMQSRTGKSQISHHRSDQGRIITSHTNKLKCWIKGGQWHHQPGCAGVHPLSHLRFPSPETTQGGGGAAGQLINHIWSARQMMLLRKIGVTL